MIEIKEINTLHESYAFVEGLLTNSFPEQERRDNSTQREYTDNKEHFHCLLIMHERNPMGVITLWDMVEFIYIEHFAIATSQRNKGYGENALQLITSTLNKPIVLEVEKPEDHITRRRIDFYKRCGFILHSCPYVQPPYRKTDHPLPMFLMTFGEINMEKMYEQVKRRIYREVYNWEI